MSTTRKKARAQDECPWEAGELGQSEEHVRVATVEEMAEVDSALGLQMISIRLQKGLLDALKEIAKHHGIGYQPMIRDLLTAIQVCVELCMAKRAATAKPLPFITLQRRNGGRGRNRTGVHGFAGRCMTTLPPGHCLIVEGLPFGRPRVTGTGAGIEFGNQQVDPERNSVSTAALMDEILD